MGRKLFKNTTQSQKTIMFFKEKGAEEVVSRTGKYTVLFSGTRYYFIGKSGAVRVNSRNSAAGSVSWTDKFKPMIKEWASNQNQKEWVSV